MGVLHIHFLLPVDEKRSSSLEEDSIYVQAGMNRSAEAVGLDERECDDGNSRTLSLLPRLRGGNRC